MSSKLQDIRQAVAAYTALQKDNTMTSLEFARKESDLAFDVITSVPDLLAIAEAAQAMRAEIKNIPQAVMTYHMYDVVADYDKALAKLEGEDIRKQAITKLTASGITVAEIHVPADAIELDETTRDSLGEVPEGTPTTTDIISADRNNAVGA